MFPSATSNLHTPTALHKSLYAVNNEWLAGPVIAILPEVPGECFYCYFSFPPEGVLYSDGVQIVEHNMRLYQRTLSNEEVCRLIHDIDESGFFEYTSEEYEQFYRSNRMKPGPLSNWITVNAWKSNSLRLTSLDFLYSMYRDTVEWPEALAVPYERLTAYDPRSMKFYMPERVAVHVEKVPEYGLDYGYEVKTWPLSTPLLGELVERYAETATQESETSDGEIILTGEEADEIFRHLNYTY
jgi:hypothetical protein